jgi:hypothetical protein
MSHSGLRNISAVVSTSPVTIVPPGGANVPVPSNISIVVRGVVAATDVNSGTVASTVNLVSMYNGTIVGVIDSLTVVPGAPTVRDYVNGAVLRVPGGHQLGAVSEVGTVIVSVSYTYDYR